MNITLEMMEKPIYIHREVLEQKLGRKLKPGECAHHKDENKRNNDPDNIELSTNSLHTKHHNPPERMKEIGKLVTPKVGSLSSNSILNEDKVREIKLRLKLKNYKTQALLAREFGVSRETIGDINGGKTWKHVII